MITSLTKRVATPAVALFLIQYQHNQRTICDSK